MLLGTLQPLGDPRQTACMMTGSFAELIHLGQQPFKLSLSYKHYLGPMAYHLKWSRAIFKLSVLKFYYNYCNDLLPKYFKNQFHLVHRYSFYAYNIRSRNLLHTTKIQTKTAEKSLRYILPKLINETIPLILNKIYTHSLYGYTNYIKQYFLSNYSYVCTIDFCYICNRE